MSNKTVDILCPLYNAEDYIENLYNSLKMQEDVKINRIHFMLTESKDNTQEYLDKNNIDYKLIKREDFSHSYTREEAALESKSDIVVFVTQDVVIEDKKWLSKLIKNIGKDNIAAAFSRQVTKFNNIEKYTREFNYPNKSYINSKEDIEEKGLKTFFFSDAASAVDLKVFKELNGYDHKKLPTNEDMYYAYKLINAGYKISYEADSVVYHSHKFTFKQTYDRYKLTGIFFKDNDYLNNYGTTGSGAKLAKYVLKRILQEKRFGLLFRYPFDMAARLFGMKAGRR